MATETNEQLNNLLKTIRTLRGDDGCPWDRKQTTNTLTRYLRLECEELIQAIANNDNENICEEIGDIFYILVMMSEISRDLGEFQFSDVIKGIDEKLIRRHPHVFAGTPYENEADLAIQWESIKAAEKKKNSV